MGIYRDYYEATLDVEREQKWLRERRNHTYQWVPCIGARTYAECLHPKTPTGRDRYPNWLKAAAKALTSDEPAYTSEAMARGTILEPIALRKYSSGKKVRAHHWEYAVIYSDDRPAMFSPDGLNVEQPIGAIASWSEKAIAPAVSYEVKCYESYRHLDLMESLNFGPSSVADFPEFIQTIYPMAVCGSIEKSVLILYAPQLKSPQMRLFSVEFERVHPIVAQQLNIIKHTLGIWPGHWKNIEEGIRTKNPQNITNESEEEIRTALAEKLAGLKGGDLLCEIN